MALKKTETDLAVEAIAGTLARCHREVEDMVTRIPAAKKALKAEPDLVKALNLVRAAARLVASEGTLVPDDEA